MNHTNKEYYILVKNLSDLPIPMERFVHSNKTAKILPFLGMIFLAFLKIIYLLHFYISK